MEYDMTWPHYDERQFEFMLTGTVTEPETVEPSPELQAPTVPAAYPCDGCGELVQEGEHLGHDPHYLCSDCYLPDCYPEPMPS